MSDFSFSIEKPGKTIFLLKSKSKPHQGGKKRKEVPLLGTLQEYQTQKAQAESQSQPVDLFAGLKKNKENQKQKKGKDNEMND